MINMAICDLKNSWKQHCYDGFPRYIGFPAQYIIENEGDFLKEVMSYVGIVDLYVSVYPESLKIAEKVDNETVRYLICNKLYIDIDTSDKVITKESLIKPYNLMKKLCIVSEELFGQIPRVYFSGGKGFAIYFDFEPTKIYNFFFVHRKFIQNLLIRAGIESAQPFDKFNYGLIDPAVLGDINRISRLPNTLNIKSQKVCFQIAPYDTLENIINDSDGITASNIVIPRFDNKLTEYLCELDTKDHSMYQERRSRKTQYQFTNNVDGDLNLLLVLAPNIKDGQRRLLFAMIIPRLVRKNFSRHEIRDYCKDWLERTGEKFDYNWQHYVEYQINYRLSKGAIPWSWTRFFKQYPDLYSTINAADRISRGVKL